MVTDIPEERAYYRGYVLVPLLTKTVILHPQDMQYVKSVNGDVQEARDEIDNWLDCEEME